MNFTNNCLSTGVNLAMPIDILFGKILFALFFRISLFNQMSIIVTYWRGCTINGPVGRSESDRSFYNPFRTDFIRRRGLSLKGAIWDELLIRRASILGPHFAQLYQF